MSASTIAEQEQGEVISSKAIREKLEEALGVAGRKRELQMLAQLRAEMLDPGRRFRSQRVEQAGAEAKQFMEVALRLGLDELRRIGPADSRKAATLTTALEWPLLLRTLRILRGWSQEELAAASGLTSSAISKQERGRRSPTKSVRERVEEALGVRDRMWELELFLGLLRTTMLDPVRWSSLPEVEEAGEEVRRIIEAALRVGLEDLRSLGDEPSGPWGLDSNEEE